jgi:hypothetical protein
MTATERPRTRLGKALERWREAERRLERSRRTGDRHEETEAEAECEKAKAEYARIVVEEARLRQYQ